jgi:hypothetical protein
MMKRATLFYALVILAAGIGASFLSSRPVAAQSRATPYNPYPPGILPPDLVFGDSESTA